MPKFYQHKSTISINKTYINKMVVLDKISFGKKDFRNFISYKTGKKFRTLCILLLKMSAYRRDFDETEYMSFLYKIMNC